jgi:hypothetical protein
VLTDLHALPLGQRCRNRDDGVAENAARIEALLGAALPRYTVTREDFQVLQRGKDAFAAKAIQGPEQHQIKLHDRMPQSASPETAAGYPSCRIHGQRTHSTDGGGLTGLLCPAHHP